MKFLFVTAAMIVALLHLHSQTIVKGEIKDSKSNLPIEGATIFVTHTSVATSSDAQGNFTLKTKRPVHSITVTSLGYESKELQITNITTILSISLKSTSDSLAPVEILGIRQPQSINSLTESDLKRFSGLGLQEAINTIPGVIMQSRTPWGGQHIILRGYYPSTDNGRSNSENFAGLGYQLYLNNIPVTDATGTTVMDDIDFLNIGKVEVIKGPSPLYGSYIAGAVNLYTPRSMPNQSGINEEVIGGSYGLFRNNTSISTSNGNSDLRLNYGHQTYTGFRPHNNSKKDYFNFATNFNLNEKNTISTYFSYNNSNEELAGEIDSADFYSRKVVSNNFYVLNNSHAAIESFRAGITDKYQFTDVLSNQTTMYTTGSTLNQAFAHGFTKNQNMNFGGRTSFMFEKNNEHTSIEGVIGGSFERTNQDTHGNFIPPFIMPPFTPSTSPNIPSASRNYALNYSLFSQWKIALPSQISITAGASVDFIEFGTQNLLHNGSIYLDNPINIKVFKPVLNPSVSLIKVFNSFVSLYATVSSGYTPATFSQMTNTNGQINTDLKPEKGIQYEIGTKGSIGKDKKLSYQVSLFDLDITNRLTQQSANGISFYTNAGEQQNKGAEVYIGYSAISNNNSLFRTVRPWISYTYSHFTYSDFKSHGKSSAGEDSIIADYSGNKVAGIPENIFNAGLDLMTKTGIYFNTTFRFNDKIPVTFTNTHFMKPYSLLSAKVGYRHQFGYHFGVDIYGGADNITNTTYYSMVFVGQNIQELAQAGDPNIPGGGGDGYILPAPYKASFYGGASLKFNF